MVAVRPGWLRLRTAHRPGSSLRRRARGRQPARSTGSGCSRACDPASLRTRRSAGRRWCRSPSRSSGALVLTAALSIVRLPRHQLGLRAQPHHARRLLAPEPRPVHHPRDHVDDDRLARRQPRRAARAPAGRRRPALGDRHRPRPPPEGSSALVPPRPARWSTGSPPTCSVRRAGRTHRCSATGPARGRAARLRALVPAVVVAGGLVAVAVVLDGWTWLLGRPRHPAPRAAAWATTAPAPSATPWSTATSSPAPAA